MRKINSMVQCGFEFTIFAIFILLFLAHNIVHAEEGNSSSAVGFWRTFDEVTSKPIGVVRIFEQNGAFFGVLEKSYAPEDLGKICDKCSDDRANKPLIGIQLIRNLRLNHGVYEGGEILDAYSGKIYRCNMQVVDNGKKLKVRGYIGISLIGRSQIWERID